MGLTRAVSSKTRLPLCHSRASAAATSARGRRRRGARVHTATSRSGSAYVSGRRTTPYTTLKIAVTDPTPRATIRMPAAANPGALRSSRAP